MAKEIERKFLVTNSGWKVNPPTYFCQAYLNRDRLRTVRVRIAGEKGWLTIKGETHGATREEFEYEIPLEDARQMMDLCLDGAIEKNRYLFQQDSLTWEIDEFLGDNRGLVVAEVELQSENQTVPLPDWIGEEVTDDPRYFNSKLAETPFCKW